MADDPMVGFLREEFRLLRVTVHDELSAMSGRLDGLSGEVRGHIPRIAVLELRVDGHDKDIQEIKETRAADQAHQRWSTSLRVSAAGMALAVLVSLVIGILSLTTGA